MRKLRKPEKSGYLPYKAVKASEAAICLAVESMLLTRPNDTGGQFYIREGSIFQVVQMA